MATDHLTEATGRQIVKLLRLITALLACVLALLLFVFLSAGVVLGILLVPAATFAGAWFIGGLAEAATRRNEASQDIL